MTTQLTNPVKILRGKHAGEIGYITGTIEGRRRLIDLGAIKILVRIGPEKLYYTEIDNVRELTKGEAFLLGVQ